jgi:large subunit ribosomal protein L31
MKEKIHPDYHEIEFKCSCGNTIKTKSTAKSDSIAICSACHPFYTGKQKIIDSAGRIEKFKMKYSKYKTEKK